MFLYCQPDKPSQPECQPAEAGLSGWSLSRDAMFWFYVLFIFYLNYVLTFKCDFLIAIYIQINSLTIFIIVCVGFCSKCFELYSARPWPKNLATSFTIFFSWLTFWLTWLNWFDWLTNLLARNTTNMNWSQYECYAREANVYCENSCNCYM